MASPDEDFSGYMESIARAEEDEQAHQALLDAHETWRNSTWGGWAVRMIQKAARHFRPFFESVINVMSDDDSLGKIIIVNLIRLLIIFFIAGVVYAMAQVLQSVLGKEIVVEEEIVIVHEYETEEQARKAKLKESQPRRSARDKRKSQ